MIAQIQRIALLLEQRRTDLAEKEIARLLAEDPDNALAHSFKALCALQRKEFDEAAALAEKAVSLNPESDYARYVLALIWFRRRHFDKAEKFINEAIALDPRDADYPALLGRIHLVRQRWSDAVEAVDRALALDPEHVEALNLRAEAMRKLGQTEDAHDQLLETLRLDPDSADTHASLGWNYLNQGQRKKAEEHFREALRLDPESYSAREGVLEALRLYNPFYRPLFRFFQWMEGLGGKARWGVVIGAYVIFRLMRAASANESLRPVLLPLIVAYVVFVLATWIGRPLMDFTLRFHSFGRLALSRDERTASTWILCLFLAGGAAFLGAWCGCDSCWPPAAFCLLMLFPLSAMFRAEKPQPRKSLIIYSAVIGALGLAGLALFSLDLLFDSPATTQTQHIRLGNVLFMLFAIGGIAAPWVSNILLSRTWRL